MTIPATANARLDVVLLTVIIPKIKANIPATTVKYLTIGIISPITETIAQIIEVTANLSDLVNMFLSKLLAS